ncbi:MAG: hypothetical protein A2W92_04230 [Bacteroidetes bacterium GWA2_42_15]|nr:MAG: hypothetical protein A2W92_04230 [Bacteroidetes bacterium GWA2_42_15]
MVSCIAQTAKYKNTLISSVKKLEMGDSIASALLIKCIPKTDKEYMSFYSLTYPSKVKVDKKSYYKLIDLFYKRALNGNESVYKFLLEMSKFVDGEFADSYFEDLDSIVAKDKSLFCKVYSIANPEKVKRLDSVYEENCK